MSAKTENAAKAYTKNRDDDSAPLETGPVVGPVTECRMIGLGGPVGWELMSIPFGTSGALLLRNGWSTSVSNSGLSRYESYAAELVLRSTSSGSLNVTVFCCGSTGRSVCLTRGGGSIDRIPCSSIMLTCNCTRDFFFEFFTREKNHKTKSWRLQSTA